VGHEKKRQTRKPRMRSGCWEETICLVSKGILYELKKEFRYARLGNNFGRVEKEMSYVTDRVVDVEGTIEENCSMQA